MQGYTTPSGYRLILRSAPHLGLWTVHMFGTGRTVKSQIHDLARHFSTAEATKGIIWILLFLPGVSDLHLGCDGICWGATSGLIKDTCQKSSHLRGQSCWGGEAKNDDWNRKMLVNIMQTWSPICTPLPPTPAPACLLSLHTSAEKLVILYRIMWSGVDVQLFLSWQEILPFHNADLDPSAVWRPVRDALWLRWEGGGGGGGWGGRWVLTGFPGE